ncbi:MAG TPA: glycogen-binding domain-containing protein [Gemmatimonadales bacterium]
MSAAARGLGLLTAVALFAAPRDAWAQQWHASTRVGRVTYEGAPAGAAAGSSFVLGLGRSAVRDWFGLSAAIPLGDDPFWAALGGWQRLATRGTAGLLLDLSATGFIQRQTSTETIGPAPTPGPLPLPPAAPVPVRSDPSGQGIGGELMAGGFAGSAPLRLELRAGVAAQRSRLGETLQERALPTGDATVSLALAPPLVLQAQSRAWLDDQTTHAYLGGTLQYARGPFRVSGSLGRWVAGGLVDRTAWSVGGGAAVARDLELQLGARGNAFDPVYLSASRTSVWGGLSVRIGGVRPIAAPVAARTHDGRATIELRARDARGAPSIAGDFTGWKPVPMRREGSRWTYTAQLAPGVYHYAFVAADGTWFVPESVPGRQDDGMGGHTAVLVVS